MRRIIKRKEALKRCDISATTQWRLEQKGLYPSRIQISPGLVGFFEDQIDAWIADRPLATGSGRRGMTSTPE